MVHGVALGGAALMGLAAALFSTVALPRQLERRARRRTNRGLLRG